MSKFKTAGFLAVLIAASPGAHAAELIVSHRWSSPAEVAALGVLEKALNRKGDTWKDLVISEESVMTVINMIDGGNPPDVFMEANPDIYRDIMGHGLDLDLGPIFDRVGATANFPQAVKDTIVVDGVVVKAPVTIHIDGMLFYNKQVAAKAGVDPTAWRSAR